MKGNKDHLCGLLDVGNFEHNVKAVSRGYEEYVLSVGDFDETIFISGNEPMSEIFNNSDKMSDLSERMRAKRTEQQQLESVSAENL